MLKVSTWYYKKMCSTRRPHNSLSFLCTLYDSLVDFKVGMPFSTTGITNLPNTFYSIGIWYVHSF